MATGQRFEGVVEREGRSPAFVRVGFEPDTVWGVKDRHHVTGTVNGIAIRGPLTKAGDAYRLPLGAAWLRGTQLAIGDAVTVVLDPEGPQRDDLDPDIAEALAAEPRAAAFFDSLAQFYRKGYLTWVGATKRRPDVRAERIAEMVRLLKGGHKQRPR